MRRSAAPLIRVVMVAALTALLVCAAGPAQATDIFGAGKDDDHSTTVTVTHTTQHTSDPAPTNTDTPAGDTTGSTPSAYPPPGPYGTWGDAFPKNPNADLSWMPGAVDACGSNWGGDGWNAKYATATPCAPEDEEEDAPPQITVEMVTAAARVVAPTSPPHVQPGAVSYVNIPNNYWTDAPTVNNSVTLLGITIALRWTPVSTTWSFGDGGSAIGTGVKDADLGAPGAIEHAYGRQGKYAISTTTAYDLTFVLPGAGAQTVRLTSPPSPAVQLPIREIQTRADYVG